MHRMNLLEALTDNIVIDKTKCTFCGRCVETCVLDNLRMKLAPCRRACPLGVNCQGYVQLIARGREDDARKLLRERLPFPGILGRVCSQPCETACHRREVTGEAVAVRALKRYLTDGESEVPVPEIPPPTGRTAAVIGSGPAGLMAAHDLRAAGHEVIVYEAESAPGGMLRWAIPEFRLPLDVLENEIGLLEKMGVEIRCGQAVGEDLFDELVGGCDTVVIALGRSGPGRLDIEGEDLPGVLHGLPFLKAVRAGRPQELSGRVVVIGGGNVAVDAAQTALRLGADSATVVSLEGAGELPAHPHALASARAEGVTFDGAWGPVRFIEQEGRVGGIELQHCLSVFGDDGCFSPCFDSQRQKILAADAVVVAIGQTLENEWLHKAGFVDAGRVKADPLTLQSGAETVFLAGDLVGGPSSVVEAMAAGRRAAESARRFLTGEHLAYGRGYEGPVETEFDIDTTAASADPRAGLPMRTGRGQGDFGELESGLGEEDARREAGRCYSCGQPFGKFRTCWFCLPCEVECPEKALWVEIPYLLR